MSWRCRGCIPSHVSMEAKAGKSVQVCEVEERTTCVWHCPSVMVFLEKGLMYSLYRVYECMF